MAKGFKTFLMFMLEMANETVSLTTTCQDRGGPIAKCPLVGRGVLRVNALDLAQHKMCLVCYSHQHF